MRYVLYFLFVCACLSGAHRQTAAAGAWSAASTWSGGVIPGNGDDVAINHAVTILDARIVGTSPADCSTPAIAIATSGSLTISGSLTVRGCVLYTPGGNTAVVTMTAGAAWHFDATQAAAPANTYYRFQQSGESGYRPFVTSGTAQQHVTVDSVAGGGNGAFSLAGFTYGGVYQFAYTDFARIGTATIPGWEWRASSYVALHNTYTNCGQIGINSGNLTILPAGGTMRHNYNVHVATVPTRTFYISSMLAASDAGTHEMIGNVFDAAATDDNCSLGGFTIRNNYFGGGIDIGAGAWALFTLNLIRQTNTSGNGFTHAGGDISNSYVFIDSDVGNPKPFQQLAAVSSNLDGVIVGQAGTSAGGSNGGDSGELWFNVNPSAATTYTVKNTIVLPNMNGYSSMEIGASTPAFPNVRVAIEHTTWFGGYAGTPGTVGFSAFDLSEAGNSVAGQITSFRSNIIWNPQRTGYTNYSMFAKLVDINTAWNNPSPQTDICSPANCDYNTGWGHTVSYPTAAAYSHQGRGYIGKFSTMPGAHDVDVNPMFVDYQRALELFSSKYLAVPASTWSTSATYSAGDRVQWSRANIYWGLSVNYRYVNLSGCGSTNPEPGAGTNWRSCWEWDSLYQIRQAVTSQSLRDDQLIGAHNVDFIETLLRWVRAGYSPTNTNLAGTAHDGADIGAVPVTFPPRAGGQYPAVPLNADREEVGQ